jgi:hypothetical protein
MGQKGAAREVLTAPSGHGKGLLDRKQEPVPFRPGKRLHGSANSRANSANILGTRTKKRQKRGHQEEVATNFRAIGKKIWKSAPVFAARENSERETTMLVSPEVRM